MCSQAITGDGLQHELIDYYNASTALYNAHKNPETWSRKATRVEEPEGPDAIATAQACCDGSGDTDADSHSDSSPRTFVDPSITRIPRPYS